MGIREDFAAFTDAHGLLQPAPGSTGGNGLRYTSEKIHALKARGILSEDDCWAYANVVLSCEKEPGLLSRAPGHPDQEGPDDIVATISGSCAAGLPFIAREILQYGERSRASLGLILRCFFKRKGGLTFWRNALCWVMTPIKVRYVYKNGDGPDDWDQAWLGRQVQVIAALKCAAGKEPTFFECLWWAGAVWLARKADPKDQDAWVLTWHLVRSKRPESLLCDWAASAWIKKYRSVHPEGLGKILGDYFQNANHPLARYLAGL